MKSAADSPRLMGARGHRVGLTFSLLLLLLPWAGVHDALLHPVVETNCAHQPNGQGSSICGDGLASQEAEPCCLCLTSQRWLPSDDPVDEVTRLEAPRQTRPVGCPIETLLPPEGSPGPRAPPHSS